MVINDLIKEKNFIQAVLEMRKTHTKKHSRANCALKEFLLIDIFVFAVAAPDVFKEIVIIGQRTDGTP